MDGGLTITFISVAMFVGCFLLGFLPLLFRLSEKGLQFVSILGAGLLCGTALAIIIPEGVGLLEESWRASSSSSAEPSSLNVSNKNAASTEGGPPPRFLIGVALTFGFILMFVVDQIGKYCSMHGKPNDSFAEQCGHHSHTGAGYPCCSGWICSGCSCGYRSSDGASHSIFGCDSTQGPSSFWFGHLSHACRPREEVHTGTFTGLFSCSTYSCHHRLLHIAYIWQFISEPAQCNRCGNALLRWDFPLCGHSACSP